MQWELVVLLSIFLEGNCELTLIAIQVLISSKLQIPFLSPLDKHYKLIFSLNVTKLKLEDMNFIKNLWKLFGNPPFDSNFRLLQIILRFFFGSIKEKNTDKILSLKLLLFYLSN